MKVQFVAHHKTTNQSDARRRAPTNVLQLKDLSNDMYDLFGVVLYCFQPVELCASPTWVHEYHSTCTWTETTLQGKQITSNLAYSRPQPQPTWCDTQGLTNIPDWDHSLGTWDRDIWYTRQRQRQGHMVNYPSYSTQAYLACHTGWLGLETQGLTKQTWLESQPQYLQVSQKQGHRSASLVANLER